MNKQANKQAIVKSGPLTGAKVEVKDWQEDHEECGFFSCILLEDKKPYKTGDEVSLEKWEILFS